MRTGVWIFRVVGGLAAVAGFIWLFHNWSAVPESFKSSRMYVVGSIAVFWVFGWVVGKIYETITRDTL